MRRYLPLLLCLLLLLLPCACGVLAPAEPPPEAPEERGPAGEMEDPPSLPEPDSDPDSDSDPDPDQNPVPEPPPVPEPAPEELVLITDYLPQVRIDLRYASPDNFTGQTIYDFTGAYLRYGTLQKLSRARELLAEEGYGLLIWDAFRPVSAQFRLWEVCPDPVYVANPERGFSSHSRGNTVDLTLVTLEGEPVEMPTDFDDFSPLADRDYSDVPEPAASHARLLEEVMTGCGFQPYEGEWWHFSDTDHYPAAEDFTPAQDPPEAGP